LDDSFLEMVGLPRRYSKYHSISIPLILDTSPHYPISFLLSEYTRSQKRNNTWIHFFESLLRVSAFFNVENTLNMMQP
jgi:hypothetical protein